MSSFFTVSAPHQILFGWSNQEDLDWRGMQHLRRGAYRVGKPEGKRPL